MRPEDLEAPLGVRRFAVEVLTGLSERPRILPSRFFYDDVGSRLFSRICELPEYYLTRCETEILSAHAADIAELAGPDPVNVVDLGAGDGRKAHLVLEGLLRAGVDTAFVPIDISEAAMKTITEATARRFAGMAVEGLVGEYFDGLQWLRRDSYRRNLVLFLGSNLGNFSYGQARSFLRQLWDALQPGDLLLVGFDLKKDIELLMRAYNDSAGLTREFNLNLLRRINRELGGQFNLDHFRHYAAYNVLRGAMESYLVSQREQDVFIEAIQQSFHFEAWEPIHVEYSYKYLESDIVALAQDTGFVGIGSYFDENRWFNDRLWEVEKQYEP